MGKVGSGLLVVLALALPLAGLSRRAGAADAIPFFKADPKPVMYGPMVLFRPEPKPVMYGPVLPDPAAPECGIDDPPCVEKHDARVLSLASASHNRTECAESSHPDSCFDAYDMLVGDFTPKADPILADPCAWVVLVDHNVAVISSKKLGTTKRLLNHGWTPRTFIGACNVTTLAPTRPTSPVIPMPAWTATRKGQLARPPVVVVAVPPQPAAPAATPPTPPAPSLPSLPATSPNATQPPPLTPPALSDAQQPRPPAP
ncbi:MAG TPA: hypothetical protein VGP07_10745 [Polyangia bacterium]|jgi:hypothetical protein